MKGRRWTEEEDRILRDAVLKSVMEGQTQIEAFEEVGKKLGRTPGACGFRWNAVLRPQNAFSYAEAKKKRVYEQIKKKKGHTFSSFAEVIPHLRQMDKAEKQLRQRIDQLQAEIKEKDRVLMRMKEENKSLQSGRIPYNQVQRELAERYQELLRLVEYLRRQPEAHPMKDAEKGEAVQAMAEHIPENSP